MEKNQRWYNLPPLRIVKAKDIKDDFGFVIKLLVEEKYHNLNIFEKHSMYNNLELLQIIKKKSAANKKIQISS